MGLAGGVFGQRRAPAPFSGPPPAAGTCRGRRGCHPCAHPRAPPHRTCTLSSACSMRSKRCSSVSPKSVTGSPSARRRRTTSSRGRLSKLGAAGASRLPAARESGRASSARLAGREPSLSLPPAAPRRLASCARGRAGRAARPEQVNAAERLSQRCAPTSCNDSHAPQAVPTRPASTHQRRPAASTHLGLALRRLLGAQLGQAQLLQLPPLHKLAPPKLLLRRLALGRHQLFELVHGCRCWWRARACRRGRRRRRRGASGGTDQQACNACAPAEMYLRVQGECRAPPDASTHRCGGARAPLSPALAPRLPRDYARAAVALQRAPSQPLREDGPDRLHAPGAPIGASRGRETCAGCLMVSRKCGGGACGRHTRPAVQAAALGGVPPASGRRLITHASVSPLHRSIHDPSEALLIPADDLFSWRCRWAGGPAGHPLPLTSTYLLPRRLQSLSAPASPLAPRV